MNWLLIGFLAVAFIDLVVVWAALRTSALAEKRAPHPEPTDFLDQLPYEPHRRPTGGIVEVDISSFLAEREGRIGNARFRKLSRDTGEWRQEVGR